MTQHPAVHIERNRIQIPEVELKRPANDPTTKHGIRLENEKQRMQMIEDLRMI